MIFLLKKNCALVGQKFSLYYLQLRHKYRLYYLEGTHYREMLRKSFILVVFWKNIPAVSQNLISICLFDLTAVMETNAASAKESRHTQCAESHFSECLCVPCHLTSSQTSGWSLEMEMYILSYRLFIKHWLFMYMVAPNSPRSLQVEVTISELQMYRRVLKGSLTCSRTLNRACSLLSPWVWLWCVHHHFILPGRLTAFQWPWRRCPARASLHKTQLQWILPSWRRKISSATAESSMKSKVLLT